MSHYDSEYRRGGGHVKPTCLSLPSAVCRDGQTRRLRTRSRLVLRLVHKALACALLALCAVGCMSGQTPRPAQAAMTDEGRKRGAAELDALLLRARQAHAEFAADLLVRALEADLVTARGEKLDLINEAFQRAREAQQPVRRKMWEGVIDTRPGYLSKTYDLRVDRLSLQCRAVKLLLPLDRQRARDLFEQIPAPDLPPLGCADALGYDLSDFYATLRAIAQTSFNPEEKSQGKHILFVLRYAEDMTSPAQVGPMLETLAALDASPDQLANLMHAFSGRLKKVSADARSFALALKYGRLLGGMQALAAACKQKGVPPDEALEAFRAYFVRGLRTAQCAESRTEKGQQKVRGYIAQVNEWLTSPISAEDINPERMEGAARIHYYWTSLKAKALLMEYKTLRFGDGPTDLPKSERRTTAWTQHLTEFRNHLETWSVADEETEADYFHQRCALYEALFEIVPPGLAQAAVTQDFTRYLRDTNIQQASRAEWLLHANYLIAQAHALKGRTRVELLEVLRYSGDAELQLYADVERLQSGVAHPD